MSALRSLALGAILVAASSACGGDDDEPTGPGGNTVTLGAASFSPSALTIDANETVTWRNTSGVLHNITFSTAGAPTNIADHTSGETDRTFGTVGTFAYSCTNHAGMNGSVTVQ